MSRLDTSVVGVQVDGPEADRVRRTVKSITLAP
jgi:hypothetical protein